MSTSSAPIKSGPAPVPDLFKDPKLKSVGANSAQKSTPIQPVNLQDSGATVKKIDSVFWGHLFLIAALACAVPAAYGFVASLFFGQALWLTSALSMVFVTIFAAFAESLASPPILQEVYFPQLVQMGNATPYAFPNSIANNSFIADRAVGIENFDGQVANNCFISSIMQAFQHNPVLRTHVYEAYRERLGMCERGLNLYNEIVNKKTSNYHPSGLSSAQLVYDFAKLVGSQQPVGFPKFVKLCQTRIQASNNDNELVLFIEKMTEFSHAFRTQSQNPVAPFPDSLNAKLSQLIDIIYNDNELFAALQADIGVVSAKIKAYSVYIAIQDSYQKALNQGGAQKALSSMRLCRGLVSDLQFAQGQQDAGEFLTSMTACLSPTDSLHMRTTEIVRYEEATQLSTEDQDVLQKAKSNMATTSNTVMSNDKILQRQVHALPILHLNIPDGSIPIAGTDLVQALLTDQADGSQNLFKAIDPTDGTLKFYKPAAKRTQIQSLGKELVVALDRFAWHQQRNKNGDLMIDKQGFPIGNTDKITTSVAMPSVLELPIGDSNPVVRYFALNAIVMHTGRGASAGHYTTLKRFINSATGQVEQILCNDAAITRQTGPYSGLAQDGYLYFYSEVDKDLADKILVAETQAAAAKAAGSKPAVQDSATTNNNAGAVNAMTGDKPAAQDPTTAKKDDIVADSSKAKGKKASSDKDQDNTKQANQGDASTAKGTPQPAIISSGS